MATELARTPAPQPNNIPASVSRRRTSSTPAARLQPAPMRGGQPAVQLSTSVGPPSTAGLSPLAAQVVTSPGAGDPLLPAVREALESSLEVPLYPVRVHTDARSAAAVD